MGLATAVNRLKDSKAKSKVIILMTDGVNNAGFIEPETAADIAQQYGIKVYTIGIGTNGMADFPYAITPNGQILFQMMKVEIDEQLLRNIAKKTEGKAQGEGKPKHGRGKKNHPVIKGRQQAMNFNDEANDNYYINQ